MSLQPRPLPRLQRSGSSIRDSLAGALSNARQVIFLGFAAWISDVYHAARVEWTRRRINKVNLYLVAERHHHASHLRALNIERVMLEQRKAALTQSASDAIAWCKKNAGVV